MSLAPPPPQPLPAQAATLPAGTRLWRIHHTRYSPDHFNPTLADPVFGGSRFDGTPDDPYGVLYASRSAATAVTVHLLRSIPFDNTGARVLPHAQISNRAFTKLRTTVPLRLIDLSSPEALAAIGATEGLTHGEPTLYAQTRYWARHLRREHPWAQGLVWQSRSNPGLGQDALVLFEDRCPPRCLEADRSVPLGVPEGTRLLNTVMLPFRATVAIDVPAAEEATAPIEDFLERTEEERKADDRTDTDFDSFYLQHYRTVRNILNARACDWDLAQYAADKAFLIAYQKWPAVSEMERPVGYVVRIGRNILQRIYARTQKPTLPPVPLDTVLESTLDHRGSDLAAETVNKIVIYDAIKNLPRDKREVFLLYEVLDQPIAIIAEFIDIPQNTVKTRLRAARAALREALGEEFGMGGTR
ncbi:RES domain-containing protein [Actinacidiphila glaucinigra]|uniref:RNA polymerase sigma factor, sigma-70 family n=1 Tax=Actinacidiphila glaucinigra TaxID=235986 RepID=A0A239NWC6_9ACTN|nr:RES domain-containing protein [Actinacidiphila glaucinigra]SNT58419.1 RNA polymerase sigma factor, sigma-70 family [Actinacidiphila glaucinigra]